MGLWSVNTRSMYGPTPIHNQTKTAPAWSMQPFHSQAEQRQSSSCSTGKSCNWRDDTNHQTRDWLRQQRTSGNEAFDEYRLATLQRLEEEHREFREFLSRLRTAKDKAEFDQFMAERRPRSELQPKA